MARPIKTFAELLRDRRVKTESQRRGLRKMRNDKLFRRKVLARAADELEAQGRHDDAERIRGILDDVDWQKVLEIIIRYLPTILSVLIMFI